MYLNWTSLTTRKYKIGLIECLLNRLFSICSEHEYRKIEIEKLKEILLQKNYPTEVIHKEISEFVLKRTLNTIIADKPDIKRFIFLPYAQSKCEDFAIRLKHLVNNNFPQKDFNVAYLTPKTNGSYFPSKYNIKRDMDKSMAIYNIKCTQCNAEYIDKTDRILSIRISEHEKG